MLTAQHDFAVGSRTRVVNRLRAVLLETDPTSEAVVDPSSRWQPAVPAELDGPFDIKAAGPRGFRSVSKHGGAKQAAADRPWVAATALASSRRPELAAESNLVRSLATKVAGDAVLVTLVDVSLFSGHDGLAAYTGLAPCDRQSGTSLRSLSPSKGDKRTLKNLLVYSCASLVGTGNRYGRHYETCRARGMRHSKALKAMAESGSRPSTRLCEDRAPYREG